MKEKNNVNIQEATIDDLSKRSRRSLIHLKSFTLWTHVDPTFRQGYLHPMQQTNDKIHFLPRRHVK